MKRYLVTAIFSLALGAGSQACVSEKPTHNSYMFSVFRREAMSSPFREDMNDWWKRYGGQPESTDYSYYQYNRERLDSIARRHGDRQMLSYMRLLDAYLDVSDKISMDSWDYPTKEELASRDSTLRALLDACEEYKGGRMDKQYALMTMRANMLLGRDKANMLYWTATASKLPDGVWREMCRNIYARALLNSGLMRQACDIYAEQGDMLSIKYCMGKYRNMAGIRKVYADDPDSPTLLYLVQDLVNNLQETIDNRLNGPQGWRIGTIGTRTVADSEARAFVAFADNVLKEGKTKSPCLWQSAAAMVEYLLGDYAEAARRAEAATGMDGSSRMKDNARCIRLLAKATTMELGGASSAWLADEFRWLDGMIAAERGRSQEYANHYTDVKERIAYNVLAPRYAAAGRPDMALALIGMATENVFGFATSGSHTADRDFTWGGEWPWNLDYSSGNEYFDVLACTPADSLAAYYTYLTSAKGDVFEHYVAQQVYANKDYYNDLIGTRYMAEGRFAEAVPYLERVSLGFLPKQNISWYMANRDYTVARWFRRQLPNTYDTDGPGKASPKENMKLRYCKEMVQMQASYNLAPEGVQKDAQAYALAVRYYQASCYGDCWFLTHYSKSINDSARTGELDFAAKAMEYLDKGSRSADMQTQYGSLYAQAFIGIDPWCDVAYDREYNPVIVPRPASAQYKALAALDLFAHEHPQAVDRHTTRCDVLKQFERLSK